MKGTLLQPILITIIAVVSFSTAEKRTELLDGNLLSWLILIAFIVSWIGYFIMKNRQKKK